MFIFGNEHTATVTGTAVKEVACEACGTRYSYLATRTATGKAFAPYFLFESHAAGSAEKQAKAEAQKLLCPACDPVPCPSCGLIQPAMVRAVRRERHTWMFNLAVSLFMLFGVATLMLACSIYAHGVRVLKGSGETLAVYAAIGGLSCILWAGRRAFAAGYDPNALDRATRIHEGRTRAVDWVTAGGRRGEEGESGWRW